MTRMAMVMLAMAMCVAALAAAPIEKGSRWTDGSTYYVVAESTPTQVKMVGGTLHEGGYQLNLTIVEGGWRVEADFEDLPDYSSWAQVGCMVERTSIDGHDLLLASSVEEPDILIAVLECVTESELEIELSVIRNSLQGTFVDETAGEWGFTSDGKVKLPGKSQAAPYVIESTYEMPSDVITLPDGRHVHPVVGLTSMELYTSQRESDDDDLWQTDMESDPLVIMNRKGDAAEVIEWASTHVLWSGVLLMFEPTELYELLDELSQRDEALASVNVGLLFQYLSAQEAESEVEEE